MMNLLTMAATGTGLAGLAVLVALAVLVLFVIPGGLGILTIEYERVTRWLRQVRGYLWRTNRGPKEERISC
jgi:hypothetical protein